MVGLKRRGPTWHDLFVYTRVFDELREVIVVDNYGALPDVYEWLIPDHVPTPASAVAAFGDLVESLPPDTRVLDCACGTGLLAVGLAGLGLDVVASDASPGMVRRTRELAEEVGVSLQTFEATWDELPDHLDASTFDVVFCVGNSLGHAEGATGRLSALASMSRLLNPRWTPSADLAHLGTRARWRPAVRRS